MQFNTASVCVVLLLIGVACAADTKPKAAEAPKKCVSTCPEAYAPVCGTQKAGAGVSGTDAPITFGSECVMTKYNCEANKKYEIKNKGECEGKAPVRLS